MFSYHMQTRIEFGAGRTEQLVQIAKEVAPGVTRWLIVTDAGVLKAGLVDGILALIHAAGWTAEVFSQVAPNPRDNDCEAGAAHFRDIGAGGVIAVGGGSAMDTAKTVALLSQCGGKPSDYADGLRTYDAVAPLICVPTTAGTGSEVTRSAVITEHTTHRKMTLKHASLRPRVALLDGLLTLTVPPSVTAATGVDALVHAIEGSTCTITTPIAQAFGYRAMRDIVTALPHAYAQPNDVEARSQMLQGSLLAGLCFGSTDVAAVHCLAEALGGLYDTPHGVANAVFLPYVIRYNTVGHEVLHANLARVMGFADSSATDAAACQALIDGVARFTRELQIPTLRELPAVKEEDFPRLVELAVLNNSTPNNIRPVHREDYLMLLKEAWAGN